MRALLPHRRGRPDHRAGSVARAAMSETNASKRMSRSGGSLRLRFPGRRCGPSGRHRARAPSASDRLERGLAAGALKHPGRARKETSMTTALRRHKPPNEDLSRLLEVAGMSKKELARSVNELSPQNAPKTTHTSVTNWIDRGMIPRPPTPQHIADVLGKRLGRIVTPDEIGMSTRGKTEADIGLDFPRDPEE